MKRETGISFLARATLTLLLALMTTATAWAAKPSSYLDLCYGVKYGIHVQGWTYDPDASDTSIDVHVYVYTDAGCTSRYGNIHVLTANVSRPDVNEAKGITGDHGFSTDIAIGDVGTYWVKVFAIDTGSDGNPQIGSTTQVTVTGLQTIASTADWDAFAGIVTRGFDYSGMVVTLTADISITTTVGTSDHPFRGTFDGGGHVLTADIRDYQGQGLAPFRYISGATIENLVVDGSVVGDMHSAGVVGFATGTGNSIVNCTVTALVSGSTHIGGILGHGLSSDINIEGCVFRGDLSGGGQAKGAFFGWGDDGGTKTVTDCLYVMYDGQQTENLDLAKGGGNVTVTRCFKTTDAGSYGHRVFADVPENEVWQEIGLAGDNYYVPCTISGINPYYSSTGSPIALSYTVTSWDGTLLTKGTDYTETISPATVQAPGDYTLTITGTGFFTGTKAIGFSVLDISVPDGMEVDNDFGYTDAGFFYVNMPKTGTKTLTLDDTSIITFKVYDDGGKNANYSRDCSGSLVLTAPDGYTIQLAGSIHTEGITLNIHTYEKTPNDYLSVYDNSEAAGTLLIDKACNEYEYFGWISIPTVWSTGRSMTLYFYSDDGRPNSSGLDLTVTLVSATNNIYVNTATGGSIESDKQKALEGETVTLTVTDTSEGYKLADISVTDADGKPVHVNCPGFTSNTATFTMPRGTATITPTFTNDWSAGGGLHVNMPATGTVDVCIPEGVKSFKLYDDGGWDGSYSQGCDGTLVLTAPEGYILQLSGNIQTWASVGSGDDLSVYDNNEPTGTLLIDNMHSNSHQLILDIPTVASSGRSLTCYFHSFTSSFTSDGYPGLNLTVLLVNPATEMDITVNTATGGTVVSDKDRSTYNETITLTATPESGRLLSDLSVTMDADGADVDVTDMLWYTGSGTATLQMPYGDITVTPTFTDTWTADGGLYINMPARGTKTATIPEGVTSFKVYDDGGPDGDYSLACDGTLVLTAPEGCVLKLSGTIRTDDSGTHMSVYDNSEASGNALISWADGLYNPQPIPVVWSTGRNMTIYFYSHSTRRCSGMDLTVKVVRSDVNYDIVLDNSSPYGTIVSDMPAQKPFETVTLTATPSTGCLLSDLSVVTVTDGINVPVGDVRWYTYNNTATFQMPPDEVTVTPTFTDDLTADGGLYINMFANENRLINIPKGVKSFKLYDDGGRNGGATIESQSNLDLHAPEGCKLRLSVSISGFNGTIRPCVMSVYDSNGILIDSRKASTIPTVTSTDEHMSINFYAGPHYDSNLDLTVEVLYLYDCSLADNADNSETIRSAVTSGEEYDVGLKGRTLYCDGAWNTLCLPFSVSDLTGTPLAAATIMELDTETETDGHRTGFSDGTLYLNFKPTTSIEAGKPYIVKSDWVDAVIPYYRVFTGTTDSAGSEVFSGLVDGQTGTDWFEFADFITKMWGCQFEILDPVIVTGYTLTTGNSVEEHLEWNPQVFDIKASMEWDWGIENATIIGSHDATQNADSALPATNRTSKTFSVAPENQRYYKYFVFSGTAPNPVVMAELELHGKKDYIKNPVFNGVTLTSTAPTAVTSQDGKVSFTGTYSPVSISGEDRHKLYLGADNALYYPNAAMTIGSCRAYFQLNGITAGDLPSAGVRAFVLNFGDEDEQTGIAGPTPAPSPAWEGKGCAWYSLDGRRLNSKPTQRGVYVNNGRKIVIK